MTTWLHRTARRTADLRLPIFPVRCAQGRRFSRQKTSMPSTRAQCPADKDQPLPSRSSAMPVMLGCLDCHYAPDRKRGAHSNFRTNRRLKHAAAMARNTSMCHSGSSHSRRGVNLRRRRLFDTDRHETDVHYKKNIHCTISIPPAKRAWETCSARQTARTATSPFRRRMRRACTEPRLCRMPCE